MTKPNHISKRNRGLYIVALVIFSLFAGAALYYMQLRSNELKIQSTMSIIDMQQKNQLINGIAKNLRTRSYILLSMLNEKDAFVLDDLNQELYHEAVLFRKNRDALKSLVLTQNQTEALANLFKLTGANAINQNKVANLLIDENKAEATSLLLGQAIPNQAPMRVAIANLITSVEKESSRVLSDLQSHIDADQLLSTALTLLISLFAIILISLLIKGIKSGDLLLANKSALNSKLIESALDAIIIVNDDGLITVFNPGASVLFGYNESDILNSHINKILTVDFNDLVEQSKTNSKQHGNEDPYFEDAAVHKDTTLIPVQIAITDTGIHGNSRFSLIIRDLSLSKESERRLKEQTHELEDARARFKHLSETDPLTQIPNRRAYEDRLADEINAAKRSNQPLALIIFDIDFFKQYNDYYGHDLGDIILKKVAQMIAQTLPRSTDFAGRFGGEEFVALLPSTDLFGAYQVAERIRLTIKSLAIKHEKSEIIKTITVSAGVSALDGDELIDIKLFKQADTALYAAKQEGRNRTNTFKANVANKSSGSV